MKSGGFSLIEILIVIVIITLTSLFITLNIGDFTSRPHNITAVAQRIESIFRVAQEQAILQDSQIGVVINTQGYRFVHLMSEQQTGQTQWRPLNKDNLLTQYTLPKGYQLAIHEMNTQQPQIIFYSSGDITPFQLHIAYDEGPRYQLIGKGNGEITLQQ